jgi:hypothetical protein
MKPNDTSIRNQTKIVQIQRDDPKRDARTDARTIENGMQRGETKRKRQDQVRKPTSPTYTNPNILHIQWNRKHNMSFIRSSTKHRNQSTSRSTMRERPNTEKAT